MTVGVVIVAAGRGERLGGPLPKQLLDLGGRSILQRSVAAFDGRPDIAELVVVLPAELVPRATELIGPTATRLSAVAGGARRQDSVRAGAEALSQAIEVVLVHDAARPFVGRDVIDRVIAAAGRDGAAVPAVPARDTVKRRDRATGRVRETVPRDDIWLAQTPQGFRRAILGAAFAAGRADAAATDDAMLAEVTGHPVTIVDGDAGNVKITTADDLAAARARLAGTTRVGTGYDLHRLADGRPLVLAGVVVSPERGPVAHSDGDVVCHAIVDAILGAAAAGDIGRHFPDSEPRWKGAPGLDLLSRAAAIAASRGWRCVNVDATVILERPKLAPHIDAIRACLAGTLGIDVGAVGLKAKSNEGVDAVGRGEAIAAHAVAVLAPAPAER